jgi:hypothetical protein
MQYKSIINFIGWVFFIIWVIVFPTLIYSRSKAYSVLEQWARTHGYKLIRVKLPMFFFGPFRSGTSSPQVIYHFTARDAKGRLLSGWARCGGWWWGPIDKTIEVQIDNSDCDLE